MLRINVTLHHDMSRNVPGGHFHVVYIFWKYILYFL